MDTSHVRKLLQQARRRTQARAADRRAAAAAAETAFEAFLEDIARPLVRQLADALRAEGVPATVSTPRGGLRLTLDRGRDDYVELGLETAGDAPEVVGRVSHGRGSRTLTQERPVKAGAGPAALGEEDVLTFFLEALEPWLER